MHVAESEMSTAYRAPEKKDQLSARISVRTLAKLAAIVRIWKAQAEAQGDDPEEIDRTYVVDVLLAKVADEELAQFGGMPASEASWREVLRAIKEANKP